MNFALSAAILLILVLLFQWNIMDAFTPFLALPILGAAWLIAIFSTLFSFVLACRHFRSGLQALLPLFVSLSAILLGVFLPFTRLWLEADFYLNRSAREQIVARIKAGELTQNVANNHSLIALPPGSDLSAGGDEIIVEGKRTDPYVFFFTFRGILGNYSGFLWVPDGQDPRYFDDVAEPNTEIVAFGGNWYFVGHR